MNQPKPLHIRTLIVGETGTGKELIAAALTPADKKLISISCASSIDRENLLESELFGYVKGAFTGAERDSVGLVTQAKNNVLFLDELHHLSISAQAKLLRFLQEMKFRRVGDNGGAETSIKFKLVTDVQSDIGERIQDKRFMTDLLERVGTLVIQVPPLRERTEDIEPLVRHFQDEFNKNPEMKKKKQVLISTINEMMKYSWPTNVRGLQNAVKRMLTNCRKDIVEPVDFKAYLENSLLGSEELEIENADSLDEATKEFQSSKIKGVLKKSKTLTAAAIGLGIPLSSFVRKLAKLEINPDLFLNQT